jgi:glycosyltransferase involved in cell wall biosynthesis
VTKTVFLMYHELKLPGRELCDGFIGHYRYAVEGSDFHRQLFHLRNRNWRGMSVGEALANSNDSLRGVAITFDDGSETDFIAAAPVLKAVGFNATFYVIVGWLGRRGYLSVTQLRELAKSGFEIGCHSMTHQSLGELVPAQARVEIADAKQKLEDILGSRIDHFSAPTGFWNRRLARIAIDAGYHSAATSRPGTNLESTDAFNLLRVVVLRSTSVHDLERMCTGRRLMLRRAREATLQIPKHLLGYSHYVKLHSIFSAKVGDHQREAITRGNRVLSVPEKALMIDYNVGDGGSAYEVMVAEAVAEKLDLARHTLDFRKWGPLKYVAAPIEFGNLRRILNNSPASEVAIKTFSAALLNPRQQPPSIVILHHLGASNNPLYSAFERYILERIPRAYAVVVVSEYWRRYLLQRGLTNVHKIHNAFKVREFGISVDEVADFKRRYCLLHKPIVYLGNYGRSKGVEEVFEVLKDLDVHLVASGTSERINRQLRCFFLGRSNYLRLLAASTVAITMSQFAEGWCRTAHEAMLCGIPVVGSGQGGMGELLGSGGQMICRDFRSLRHVVESLLEDEARRTELGCKGREFARQFSYERFQSEWVDLIKTVVHAAACEKQVILPDAGLPVEQAGPRP